ncbi:hypothetical protein ACWN8V_03185 [Vagococcus elongatus]|uniref:Glycosyl hydrolase n=1 Tax=Vagococcus elongatus TaxID=180344 RepID=A0A430B1T5_9ENTE|nr:hypothetical protein CBF29_03015 [Vagococcus elongatus]
MVQDITNSIKLETGGETWTIKNDNPFSGTGGVAIGIEFFDSSYGYIGISGASGNKSKIWLTRDGGESFTEIQLPMEAVDKLPAEGEKYGLSIEDYQYLSMPEYDNKSLTIKVMTNSEEDTGILFESLDKGASWKLKN